MCHFIQSRPSSCAICVSEKRAQLGSRAQLEGRAKFGKIVIINLTTSFLGRFRVINIHKIDSFIV